MFWIELIIVLAIIFIGVRVGGTFLAMAGGIGMFIMTFILHVTPSDSSYLCGGNNTGFRRVGLPRPHSGENPEKEPENDYGTGSGCSIYLYIYVWYRSYRLQSSSGYQRNCH